MAEYKPWAILQKVKKKINNKIIKLNMKRNLRNLLILATAIFSICGSAEARSIKPTKAASWLPARMAAAPGVDDNTTYSADIIESGEYYIRNSEAGTFFSGGNSWGTRLSLKSAGDRIKVTRIGETEGYIFEDLSLVDKGTGAQIGEAGSVDIFIDQTSPAEGYKFHKLTAEEIAIINKEDGANFGEGVGQTYYYIYYVGKYSKKTVYLTEDVPAESGHSQISGKEIDPELGRPDKHAVWELFTREELAKDLFENANKEDYKSATPFLVNPDFSRNYHASGQATTNNGWNNEKKIGGISGWNENFVAWADHQAFDINQTITDLPNGEYALVAYGVYDATGPGDGEDPCFYVVAGGEEKKSKFTNFTGIYATELSIAGKVAANVAKYRLDTIKVKIWDNTLKVGFRSGRSDVYSTFDNVQIIYYGPITDLTTLIKKYQTVKNQAEKLAKGTRPMSIEAKNKLQTAINNVPDLFDGKATTNAIAELSNAVTFAQASVTLYNSLVSKYETEVSKLSAEAQAYYNENVKAPIIDAGILKSEDQLIKGLKIAQIIDRGKNADVTDIAIINPDFEMGDGTGWSLDDGGSFGGETSVKDLNNPNETRYAMSAPEGYKVGAHLFNTWYGSGGYPIYQDIPLAAGTYQLSALMASTLNTHFIHLTANGKTETVVSDEESKGKGITLTFDVDDAATVRIIAWASIGDNVNYEDGNHAWFKVDDFHLIYKGPKDLSELVADLDEQIGNADALLKKAMNADIKLDLQNAKRNGTNVRTGSEKQIKDAIVTLKTCIAAAQKSVNIYDNIESVMKKGQSLDASGVEAFNKFIEKVQTAWSEGTITDGAAELQEANSQYIAAIKQQSTPGIEMTQSVKDWECNSGYVKGQFGWNERAQAVVKGWYIWDPEKQAKISLNQYFHVNTWSTEAETGVDGGTPMTIPFTEFWSDAGENYLGNHHLLIMHEGESGYRPGRYTIGIMARLGQFAVDGETPTGYKFYANEVNSKTQYRKSDGANFYYAFDEIDILVDEDGKLDFGFELDHPNFSWLAFKMLKLVYQGDSYSDESVANRISSTTDKYIGRPMNAEVENNLKKAINIFSSEPTIKNGKLLDKAENEAEASLKLYEQIEADIQKYVDKESEYTYNGITGFDETGHLEFTKKINDLLKQYDDRTLTEDNKDDAKNAYLEGLLSQGTGDFTELIVNPGFEQGMTGWTFDEGGDSGSKSLSNETYETTVDDSSVQLGNQIFNIWKSNEPTDGGGMLKQTIKGLPNGKYRISAYVATFNDYYVFLHANDVHGEGVNNNDPKYSRSEAKKHAKYAEVEAKVTNKQLKFGAIGGVGSEYPDYPNQMGCWYKVDNFRLEYLGAIDNKDLLDKLKITIEYANQFIHEPMNKDSLALLSNAYIAAITANVNTDADDILRIDKELRAYANHTKSSIEIYKNINTYLDRAEKLDADGYKEFNKIAGDVIAAYKSGTITDGKEEMSILEDKLRIATKAQTTPNSDWTGAIYNPSFENRMQHWESEGTYKPLESMRADNYPWAGTSGSRYGFRNNSDNVPQKVKMFQNIDSVSIGVYKLRATVYTNSKTMSLFGNDLTVNVPQSDNPDEAKEIEQIVVSWDGKRITLGVIGSLMGGEQFRIDNIRLEFVSKELNLEKEKVPADVPMNKQTREKQDKMLLAFRYNPQPENLMDAINAINEAKESAAAYAKAKVIMDSCVNYMQHSNVYSQRAMDYCMQVFNPFYEGWQNGTLTNQDIANMTYSIYQNGFEFFNDQLAKEFTSDQNIREKYPILYYIFDAWEIDKNGMGEYRGSTDYFKINTWSTEVNKDDIKPENSEMTTPFIEYWTKKENISLDDATIHGKAINLEPGLYTMKVLTRVANENRDVAADEYEGITLHVETDRVKENNGVDKYVSKTVDVCKGEAHNDDGINVVSQVFQVDSIIVREKDNHDAEIYFDVENTNANWFNWKFCQFVKVRDLFFWEENDLASDEEIKKLKELIKRDEKKRIGFNINEYSTYDNRELIVAHNSAKKYLEDNGTVLDDGHHRLTKYQINLYIKALEDESKWIMQDGDVNCVHNPNFWLVKENYYAELPGWTIHDTGVANPKIGGFGITCATATSEFTKFNNIAGSINLDGKENIFSTAAKFVFDNNSFGFCSPKSVYYYGEEDGLEMPLDPDQEYSFTAQLGYFTEGQKGSVTFDIVDEGNHSVLDKPFVVEPKICVTDTMKIPETYMFTFHTNKASSSYVNTLANYNNLKKYKLVVKNTDPNNIWTMVISNIKLYRWPNAIMEIKKNAHWGTFIAPFDTQIPTGLSAFVVTGKEDETFEYVDPETNETILYTNLHVNKNVSNLVYVDEKNVERVTGEFTMSVLTYIPAHTPVLIWTSNPAGHYSVASGRKAYERKDQERFYRLKDPKTGKYNNNVYLEGWEGILSEDKTSMKPLPSQDGWYILQKHGEDKEACFYQVNENNPNIKDVPNVPANRCWLVDPTFDRSNPSRIRKFVFSIDDAIEEYTSIENSDNQNQEIKVIGIYSANGTPQKTFKPGINIIKMSDGTSRKKFIK